MCVVVAFAQGGHIVRSLRHVDFFHRSPPGHPTSKLAQPRQNWFMIDEQSLLTLERVVGFWVVLCGGRRADGWKAEKGQAQKSP